MAKTQLTRENLSDTPMSTCPSASALFLIGLFGVAALLWTGAGEGLGFCQESSCPLPFSLVLTQCRKCFVFFLRLSGGARPFSVRCGEDFLPGVSASQTRTGGLSSRHRRASLLQTILRHLFIWASCSSFFC